MKKLFKLKILIITIIIVLVFTITILTGCTEDSFPVTTVDAYVLKENEIHFIGSFSWMCSAKNQTFVYDTVKHENWEDYKYIVPENIIFIRVTWFLGYANVFTPGEYHVRAIAYCYDFKPPFKHYEEGWYQGEDLTVIYP